MKSSLIANCNFDLRQGHGKGGKGEKGGKGGKSGKGGLSSVIGNNNNSQAGNLRSERGNLDKDIHVDRFLNNVRW